MSFQIESPEELIAKHGYTPEQAKQLHAAILANEGKRSPLNLRTFTSAQHYFESSNVLDQHISKAGNANVVPGIVLCKSFALELFFKTLVILDRDDVMDIKQLSRQERDSYCIHAIPELYDEIPFKYKDKLATIYSARMSVVRLPHDKFRSELVEKANDIFVEWRYVHEKHGAPAKHLNIDVLNNLIISAQLVTLEVKNAK